MKEELKSFHKKKEKIGWEKRLVSVTIKHSQLLENLLWKQCFLGCPPPPHLPIPFRTQLFPLTYICHKQEIKRPVITSNPSGFSAGDGGDEVASTEEGV